MKYRSTNPVVKTFHLFVFRLQAYACMEEMRGRIPNVQLTFYVNMRTIEAIHRELNMPLSRTDGPGKMAGYGQDEDDGEIVEEEVGMYNGQDDV